jgi:hypothetical protein
MRINRLLLLIPLIPTVLMGQDVQDFKKVLERLDKLELQNHELLEEVHALRKELGRAPAAAPELADSAAGEKLEVQAARVEELHETKVEASQRLPLSITGMVLFNTFWNGRNSGGNDQPLIASQSTGLNTVGATLRQSVIGLKYDGGQTVLGARVSGFLNLDLWGGSSASLNNLVRLATASVRLDWKNQTVTVGQDKPLIAPRNPTSLALVSIAPLAASGNLWTWAPQARFEQRFALGENMGVRAQTAFYVTQERSPYDPALLQSSLDGTRPSWEGRFEFWRSLPHGGRIEIAPGFHASDTHVLGFAVPSRIATLDWLVRPWTALEITGAYFHGQNAAGLGGLSEGFSVPGPRAVLPVHSAGGWVQASYRATNRITLNAFAGKQSNRFADLETGDIGWNLQYGANAIVRIAPNVLFGLEGTQLRTRYLGSAERLQDHYDLSLAYLF